MIAALTRRLLTETQPRLLWKFLYDFGWKGMRAVQKFEKRLQQGQFFPAFLFLSVTNNCNLSCQGCWCTPSSPPKQLSLDTMDNIVTSCKLQGSHFFGILGGEPLLHPDVLELFRRHPDAYFLLFTNGLLLTDSIARELNRLGNVSPLISVEGLGPVSDERRGGRSVYERTLSGVEACRKHKLITGVATSLCQSNVADLATERFLREMIARGVHYAWYDLYRPVGPRPTPELALTAEQVLAVRRFIVDIRARLPIAVVDAYWDAQGGALCPAVVGMAHHISPSGDIEPCPPLQFARDNVGDGRNLEQVFADSEFLSRFRREISKTTQGCIILENPALLKRFLEESGASDSSGRGTAFDELARMDVRPSHHLPGEEIPEKHWAYRLAKKFWFFGFGAYG